jgi:hypothetical protein
MEYTIYTMTQENNHTIQAVPATAPKSVTETLQAQRDLLEEQLNQGDKDYAKIKAEGNGNDALRNKIVAETLVELAKLDREILASKKAMDEKYAVGAKSKEAEWKGLNANGFDNFQKRGNQG